MNRHIIYLAVLLPALLGACGVKGPLENPPVAQGVGASPSTTAQADSGQGKAEGTAAKPHKPFILDGLLR
jgi:predicted small lipoprotein YifL